MTDPLDTSHHSPLDVKTLELLISRLCHDLVSPVGAINNGVELIEDVGTEMVADAMALIAQSGRQAAARLQCFRLAYGAAGGQAGVGLSEVQDIAAAWLAGGKVSLDWTLTSDVPGDDAPVGTAKMLLNAVILADEALSYGGRLTVAADRTGPSAGITVTATGRGVALSDERVRALNGDTASDALTPRTIHAHATGMFARYYGIAVTHEQMAADALVLRIGKSGPAPSQADPNT